MWERVAQQTPDHAASLPMVVGVRQRCGETPPQVSADSDFFALSPLRELDRQGVEAYVPDSNLARVLNRGGRLRARAQHPVHQHLRRKLRGPQGRTIFGNRKTLIEPILRAAERATGDEAIPAAGNGERDGRGVAGHHRLPPDPLVKGFAGGSQSG